MQLARRALAQLANSVLSMQRLATDLESRLKPRNRLALSSWEDAWWDAGWLILRTESYRDAASEALLRASGSEAGPGLIPDVALVDPGGRFPAPAFATELGGQLDVYREARLAIEQRLVVAGRPLRDAERRPPQPVRGPRLAVATALFVALLTVTTAVAGVAILGGALGRPSDVSQGPVERTGGVLGAGTGPSIPPPSAAASRSRALVAMLDFNILRIGTLEGASSAIDAVTGDAEVVPFPSPFNRSVRLTGSGPDGFCIADDSFGSGGISVAMDLYVSVAVASGSLDLVLSPRTGDVTAASIPLNLFATLPPEHWYHLTADWGPGTTVAIEVSGEERGRLLSETLPPVVTTIEGPSSQGLCLAASGMSSGAQLLVDNVQVEQ